jgi:hypothetical protein
MFLIALSWLALVLGSPLIPQGSAHIHDARRSAGPGNGLLGAIGSANNGKADRRGLDQGRQSVPVSFFSVNCQEEKEPKFSAYLFQMLPMDL